MTTQRKATGLRVAEWGIPGWQSVLVGGRAAADCLLARNASRWGCAGVGCAGSHVCHAWSAGAAPGGCLAGRVGNLDLDRRHERPWPMVIVLGITVIGLTVLWMLGAPHLLLILLISTLIGGTIALLITLRWKISIHAGGAAGAATVMALLYGAVALPLLIGVGLIGWSRVVLGKHTWPQVVAGAADLCRDYVLVFGIGWP